MRLFVSLLILIASCFALGVGTIAGPYRVDVVTDPAVVPIGKANLLVKITDSSGKPVTGATVRGIAQMPGMPMGEREQTALPGDQAGTYRIPASFAMAGGYEAKISISSPLGSAVATVQMETGKSTAADQAPGFPWSVLLWILGGVALVGFVIFRMRKTGQSVDVRPIFSRSVVIAVVLFALVIIAAIYSVNR